MTRIYDNLFLGSGCLHANGDNEGRLPNVVRWVREGPSELAWFTDSTLSLAPQIDAKTKIAWILEPSCLRTIPYDYIEEHDDQFDIILTYDEEILEKVHKKAKVLPYVFGGSRINEADWACGQNKSRMVSIVISPKLSTDGHRLRYEVLQDVGRLIDPYGQNFNPLPRKLNSLSPYFFQVAIENCRSNNWFTEALIDPMLTGCVPIYWGFPKLGELFDKRGVIEVTNRKELVDAIHSVSYDLYCQMHPYVVNNFKLAQKYQ